MDYLGLTWSCRRDTRRSEVDPLCRKLYRFGGRSIPWQANRIRRGAIEWLELIIACLNGSDPLLPTIIGTSLIDSQPEPHYISLRHVPLQVGKLCPLSFLRCHLRTRTAYWQSHTGYGTFALLLFPRPTVSLSKCFAPHVACLLACASLSALLFTSGSLVSPCTNAFRCRAISRLCTVRRMSGHPLPNNSKTLRWLMKAGR